MEDGWHLMSELLSAPKFIFYMMKTLIASRWCFVENDFKLI